MPYRETITQEKLYKRGWTRGLIERFAPKPILKRNGFNRFKPKQLFYLDEIQKIEESEAFQLAAALALPKRLHHDLSDSDRKRAINLAG